MMTMMMLMLMLMLLLVVVVTDKNDVVKCHTFKNYSLMLFCPHRSSRAGTRGTVRITRDDVFTQKFLHREAFTQKPSHGAAFTHRSFYTHTQKPLRTETFTQIYTEQPLFTHKSFYTQTLYTQRSHGAAKTDCQVLDRKVLKVGARTAHSSWLKG